MTNIYNTETLESAPNTQKQSLRKLGLCSKRKEKSEMAVFA